ncbi:MAG: hypothetical protein WKG00_15805 [Polyangiaceae bacterium]
MLVRALALATLPFALTACGVVDSFGPSSCDRSLDGNPYQPYVDGTVDTHGVFRSELPTGELLDFPGGAHWKIAHHLGEEPMWWTFYLSFERMGLEKEGGAYAQAAGNQAVLYDKDAANLFVVNDSCSDYFLRVVAGTDAPQ